MIRKIGALAALFVVLGPAAAAAQQPAPQADGEIRGVVQDGGSGQPLAGASVAVRRAADSTLVAGGVTRADGAFRIQGLRPDLYYLRVSRLGYTTGTVPRVTVSAARQVADAGTVRLAAGAVALQGITASTQRQTVGTSPDRTVVSTANMATVTGGTATDVLRNVPGLDVDGDGQVSLRGNSAIAIQINGRTSPLSGDALTNFIKQLPANLIDRVEVVPNPSAKNDPDGMGGIINIVLKQNADLGTSGGFSLTGGSGEKYSGSGNLGTQTGPLTLFGSYGLNHGHRSSVGTLFRDEHFSGLPRAFQEQRTRGENGNTSHTGNASGELKLGSRDVLSSNLMLNHRAGDSRAVNGYTRLDAARAPMLSYAQATGAGQSELTTDYALGLKHTVTPRKNELSAEVRFDRERESSVTSFATLPGGSPPPEVLGDSRTTLGAVTRQLDAQLDYTRELHAGTLLETGYKGSFRRLANAYALDSLFNGVPDPSLRLANDFDYAENVNAGYALLTREAGPLTLQAGARLELATTRFRLAGSPRSLPNDYTTLFPSAAATWQPTERDEVRLSYSKRIERPEAERLNPFPFVQDPFHVVVGNPTLKPEYEHAFELSYQRSVPFGSLSVTPFYRHVVIEIKRFHIIGPDGVDTTTFRNLDSSDQYGSELHAQLASGRRVSGFVGATVFGLSSNGANVQQGLSASGFAWTARANLNLKLDPRTDVQWFQSYRAARNTEQGRQGATSIANVAVRRRITDQATLNLRVADPFDTMRSSSLLDSGELTETQSRRFDSRAVYVSFTYTFGHPPRLRETPPEQDPLGSQGS